MLPAEASELIRQALQDGFVRAGFVGGKDTQNGINFGFALDNSVAIDGPVAKRFLVNARKWVMARAKELSAQKGEAVPVVHEFQFSRQFRDVQKNATAKNVATPEPKT